MWDGVENRWTFFDPSGNLAEMFILDMNLTAISINDNQFSYPPTGHTWLQIVANVIVDYQDVPIYCVGK